MDESKHNRHKERQPVLKAAKIHFNRSVVDCLIHDLSANGLRVSTYLPTIFPPEVMIEFRSGAMWNAVYKWQKGEEAGFQLTSFATLHGEAAQRAAVFLEGLKVRGVREVLNAMVAEKCFEVPVLADAVQQAEIAVSNLERALQDAVRPNMGGPEGGPR